MSPTSGWLAAAGVVVGLVSLLLALLLVRHGAGRPAQLVLGLHFLFLVVAVLVTDWGWAVGGVVAGLLLLSINPLQRFAGRIADAAMPRVADTEEYLGRRKEEVYRATLAEMLVDGSVSVKERRILMRLQEDLGLDADLALRLEREVMDRGVAA